MISIVCIFKISRALFHSSKNANEDEGNVLVCDFFILFLTWFYKCKFVLILWHLRLKIQRHFTSCVGFKMFQCEYFVDVSKEPTGIFPKKISSEK